MTDTTDTDTTDTTPTIRPVENSGWYERTSGQVTFYHWANGMLCQGTTVASWDDVPSRPRTDAELAAALGELDARGSER